jgi:hypothetical protein
MTGTNPPSLAKDQKGDAKPDKIQNPKRKKRTAPIRDGSRSFVDDLNEIEDLTPV